MKKNVVAFIGDAVRGALSRSFNPVDLTDMVSGEIVAKNQLPPDVAPSIVTPLPPKLSAQEEAEIEKRRSFASTLRTVATGLKDGGASEALPFFRSSFDPLHIYAEFGKTYTMTLTLTQAADALEKKSNHVGNELYDHLLRVEKAFKNDFAFIADSYVQNLQVMNQPLSRASPSKPS